MDVFSLLILCIFPVFWFFVYSSWSDLPEFTSLKTKSGKVTTKTTSRVKSNSILTDPEPIHCPMPIDNEFISVIRFIPWFSIYQTYQGCDLEWSINSIIRMESSMNQDKIISLNNMRKWYEPFSMSPGYDNVSQFSGLLILRMNPTLVSVTEMSRFDCESIDFFRRKKWKVLMIPENTPSIGTISDKLYNLDWFWSLVDNISNKIEMIFGFQSYFCYKGYQLIIATMNITNKKSARHIKIYFLGNHGTKTLVFLLYSSQSGRPAYLTSWSGTPDTNKRRKVITNQDIKP